MDHLRNDQKEGGKQVAPPTKERKGYVCTDVVGENPNGRQSKDLIPKFKPKTLGGKGVQKENRKT
jgi:hypothetical protein